MDQAVLVNEQLDAGSAFLEAFNKSVPVDAAFWMNEADSPSWYLYVASKAVNDSNLRDKYREVLNVAEKAKNLWLDPFRIKLVNSNNRLASQVIEVQTLYPIKHPTRFNGSSIGGVAIDGAYIYPPITTPAAMSAN